MKYITFCKTCNVITGHAIHGLRSTCMKCNTEKRTPVIRWAAGFALAVFFTFIALWIIYSAVIVLIDIF